MFEGTGLVGNGNKGGASALEAMPEVVAFDGIDCSTIGAGTLSVEDGPR